MKTRTYEIKVDVWHSIVDSNQLTN